MGAAYLKAPPVLPSVRIPYWCAGKEAFESAVLAADIAARCRAEAREIYRCRTCGSFHIGSQRSRHRPAASATVTAELIRSA